MLSFKIQYVKRSKLFNFIKKLFTKQKAIETVKPDENTAIYEDRFARSEAILNTLLSDPVKNQKHIKGAVQAMVEGFRDILSSSILNPQAGNPAVVDQNNYITYESQIYQIYYMYNARSKYGACLLGGIVDVRTAFIAGGGLSIASTLEADEADNSDEIQALTDNMATGDTDNPMMNEAPPETEPEEEDEVECFLNKIIDDNDLNGHRLVKLIKTGEMEGKCLMVLIADKKNKKIKVRHFSWRLSRYDIITDPADREKVIKVVYYDDDGAAHEIDADECVYVKIGGSTDKINETPPKIAKVLTQIENFDRSLYDERKNNFLFGRVTPVFKTDNVQEAKALQTNIQGKRWNVGDGYVGNADHYYVEPSGKASEVLRSERTDLLRVISMSVGIPAHFLAYPDLLSNRATADSMVEVLQAMTSEERYIWEKSFKELFQKAMVMATDEGFDWACNYQDDFIVKLNQSSWMQLKSIIETWSPLQDKDVISMATLRNMCPGILPQEEKCLIQKEKTENMQNSPMFNMANMKSELDLKTNPPNNQLPNAASRDEDGVKRNTGNIVQSFEHKEHLSFKKKKR
jgi:hypothetical protein